ncbi:MAG: hypothetical protein LWW87_07610 [Geobacteraceae bacterium]|nr:hypothetical protein [Geobacteraceae bacterium]
MRSTFLGLYILLFLTTADALADLPNGQQPDEMRTMIDKLDRLDKLDFDASLEKAYSCIRARNFDCVEKQLAKAKKYMHGNSDKQQLLLAKNSLQQEREQVIREREEEERRVREAEERRRREEQKRREEEERERRAEERRIAQNNQKAFINALNQTSRALAQYNQQTQRTYYTPTYQAPETPRVTRDDEYQQQRLKEKHEAEKRKSYEEQQRLKKRLAEQEASKKYASSYEPPNARKQYVASSSNTTTSNERNRLLKQQIEQDVNKKRDELLRQQKLQAEQEAARKKKQQEEIQRLREKEQEEIKRAREKELEEIKRKAEQDRKKQEQEQARLAELKKKEQEKAAEEKAKQDYLKTVSAGVRLKAINCFGKSYVSGTMPRIRPEKVACVDVLFRATCPGSVTGSTGRAKNFVGLSGCYGDTYDIQPALPCKAEEIRVSVTDVVPCR